MLRTRNLSAPLKSYWTTGEYVLHPWLEDHYAAHGLIVFLSCIDFFQYSAKLLYSCESGVGLTAVIISLHSGFFGWPSSLVQQSLPTVLLRQSATTVQSQGSILLLEAGDYISFAAPSLTRSQTSPKHLVKVYEWRTALIQRADHSNIDNSAKEEFNRCEKKAYRQAQDRESFLSNSSWILPREETKGWALCPLLAVVFVWLSVHWRSMFINSVCFSVTLWFCHHGKFPS